MSKMVTIIPTPKVCNELKEENVQVKPAIYTETPEFREKCNMFTDDFKKLTGCELQFEKGGIELKLNKSLNTEQYTIDCEEGRIILSASSSEGISYALASLTQIASLTEDVISCPCVHIEDYPDKEYRSLMVDLARQWHPACTLYKYIDVCYIYKVKYLHLNFC